MDLAKHEIRVVDDEPCKERFQRILPLKVDEVCAHMKEMLEVGSICPSQSPWHDVVVLVWKKDGSLCFCIDFCKLNARTKKDSYWLPWIQEAIECLVGAVCFSSLDLKGGCLANWHEWSMEAIHCFHCGKPRIFWVHTYAIQAVQCPCHFSKVNAELLRGTEPDILLNLFGWCASLHNDRAGALVTLACCVWLLPGTQPEVKTH